MKTSKFFGILAMAVLLGLALTAFSPIQAVQAASLEGRRGPGGPGNPGRQPADPSTPLTAEEQSALQEAIREEYGALNLYTSVIDQYGAVYPFDTIARAEQQHVNALTRQADKYGVDVPQNPGLASPVSFDTLAAACQAGVAAEIADAALYDELKQVTTHADILRVYTNLQNASLNNHLPAFQTCD